jgi:serine/threonine protein kinase
LLSTESPSMDSMMNRILDNVLEAFKFLHHKNIAHNDISDRNILLIRDEEAASPDNPYRAVLVDFSIASQMYKRCCGLIGTPPFIHRELHINYDWFPVPQYDETSLGLTLVVLVARGIIPWDDLNDKGTTGAEVYAKRLTAVTTLLNEECGKKNLTPNTVKRILGLCKLDKQKFRTACKCSSKLCRGRCGCRDSSCSCLCSCYDNESSTNTCGRGFLPSNNTLDDCDDPFLHRLDCNAFAPRVQVESC